MAYLGNDLQVAFPTYRNIDDISGSFNGVTTSFPLTVAGVAPIPAPINSQQCLISVNGVVQRPDDSGTEGFRLSGGNIIFASAPAGGVDFFGVILAGADYVNIGANFPSGTAVAPSITFDSDLDTGIYNPAGNQIGFTTSGTERLVINSSGQVSGGLGTAAAPVISFISDPNTGIYSPGADQVAISTGGSGRLFVDSSGRVGVGTTSPGAELNIVKNLSGGLGAQLIVENQFGNAGSEAAILCRTNLACKAGLHVVADDGGTGTGNGNYLYFTTTPGGSTTESERARIDRSGRFLVGTSTSINNALEGGVQIVGTGADAYLTLTRFDTITSAPAGIILGRSKSGTKGTNTAVSDGDFLGVVEFTGADGGSSYRSAAQIGAYVDGAVSGGGAADMPGRLVFSTTADGASSPTERLRIDSSGRVGIGTTGPAALLDVYKGSGLGYVDSILLSNSFANGANQGIAWGSATNISGRIKGLDDGAYGTHLIFESRTGSGPSTTTSERARIDSSGRLLVGTSSARSPLTHTPSIQVEGLGYQTSTVSVVSNSNDTNGAYSFLGKSRGTSLGSNTIVQSGDEIGGLDFIAADGTQLLRAARITALVDGTPGANDMPGRLVFSTTADGASSPTERMRITNDGQTYFGITGNTGLGTTNRGFLIRNELAGKTYVQLASTGTTTDTVFYFYNGNGLVGSISMNGSATAYNTSSDYRLKENVAPVPDGITRLQQLKPSRFNFIADPATTVDGFIAHEVQAVVPEAITGEKDAVDDDGNPIYQGIDQSKLVPLLTAALQEAIGEIESLKARLTAAGI